MFYTVSQISELEKNPILSEGEIDFAKELFANASNAQFERSKYPVTSDGSQHQAFARVGNWLLVGTLRQDNTFTTELGSWNYLVLDFSQAVEASGIRRRMNELDEQERRFNAWAEME